MKPEHAHPPETRLHDGPLPLAHWLSLPAPPDCGAVASFVGTVRDQHAGRAVIGIHYHAHRPLAETRLAVLEQQAQMRFGARVVVAHALGALGIGDASVVIVAFAPHRGAAFDACRWTIDTLKMTVPIWKEEFYADGSREFQEGTPLDDLPPASGGA